jgi:hypothetical protein
MASSSSWGFNAADRMDAPAPSESVRSRSLTAVRKQRDRVRDDTRSLIGVPSNDERVALVSVPQRKAVLQSEVVLWPTRDLLLFSDFSFHT